MSAAGRTVASIPNLAGEWNRKRNNGADPATVLAGSNKEFWWRCQRGHEFRKSPNGRTNNGRATGRIGACPQCRAQDGGLSYWSWDKIVATAAAVAATEGALPPAAYFQRRGLAMLIQCLYKHGKTWDELREEVGSFEGATFVESRSGQRWRSHAEASLSNFLHARGVRHHKGRRYPKAYERFSGRKSGFYDVHFQSVFGEQIDVEIWGDKPHIDAEQRYAATRAFKERFNEGRPTFLGIHYLDCYSDRRLEAILRPYIGTLAPFVYTKDHDRSIESCHWSNADELLETCRRIAAEQSDGKLPTEEWMRKRGRYAKRPGPSYNTLAVYIRLWLGGMRQARALIGQPEHSTVKWDRNTALRELHVWVKRYGDSPRAISSAARRQRIDLAPGEAKRANNIAAAISRYVGTMEVAYRALGVDPSRNSRRQTTPVITSLAQRRSVSHRS